jgi:pyruvate dehydrogenase E2 component (dihydrolipoamide acetyltransferase)
MATSIIMPKAEMAMEEGTLVRWLVPEGGAVVKGRPVLEVETDKSTLEVEAEADGILLCTLIPEGRRVPVTTVLGWIGEAGEPIPSPQGPDVNQQAPSGGPPPGKPRVAPRALPVSVGAPGRIPASPAAKRLASERGVDLRPLHAAAGGRPLTVADVLRHADSAGSPPAIVPEDPSDTVVPLTPIQRTSARRLAEAHREAAAVTLHARADVTDLGALRERVERDEGLRPTYNDLVLKAVAATLRASPELNAVFLGDRILRRGRIHLSMAVDTDRGLLVPVLRDADRLTLVELAREARRLAERARAGGLKPGEQDGGTFTVTNIGRHGIAAFTPVLNLPQVAILGVCAIEEVLQLRAGRVDPRRMMGLSLTFDHRAMDGVPPAAFLGRLCQCLGDPDLVAADPLRVVRDDG